MRVRLGRGKVLGEVEEYFVSMLDPGRHLPVRRPAARVRGHPQQRGDRRRWPRPRATRRCPPMPAAGCRSPRTWPTGCAICWPSRRPGTACRSRSASGWRPRRGARMLTAPDELLVETFARGARHYLVAYCFAGRNAHQTLGMLLTRRMERRGLRPLGFVASDYCIATWGAEPIDDVAEPVRVDILGDDLEEWMAESSLIKRTFRNCAVVAGPDRAAPSRPGEDRPAGDLQRRPDLRRAAQVRARPRAAARGPGRGRGGPDRHPPPRRPAGRGPGPHPPCPARPDLALRGLDHRRHRQGVRHAARCSTNRWTRRWRNWSRRPWPTRSCAPCSCSSAASPSSSTRAAPCSGRATRCWSWPTCTWRRAARFARRGSLLPPYDSHATLARLEALIARHRPDTVVSLGDGFHDRRGRQRAVARPVRPAVRPDPAAALGLGHRQP